jgi:hypothetical protein
MRATVSPTRSGAAAPASGWSIVGLAKRCSSMDRLVAATLDPRRSARSPLTVRERVLDCGRPRRIVTRDRGLKSTGLARTRPGRDGKELAGHQSSAAAAH